MKKFIVNLFAFRNFPDKPFTVPMIALGSLFVSICCSQMITKLAHYFPSNRPKELESLSDVISSSDGILLLLVFVSIGVVFPLLEELFFRGVLWRITEVLNLPAYLKILLVSIIFSALHSEMLWIIGVFPLAVWLGCLRYHFNSIYPSLIAHITVNSGTILWLVFNS